MDIFLYSALSFRKKSIPFSGNSQFMRFWMPLSKNHKSLLDICIVERRIDRVRLSDAKEWLIRLQQEGRGYSSIHSIRGVVRPAFQMAVDDDLIRKNPFSFQLATVVVNDSVTREALTHKQERAFLEFVAADKHFQKYYSTIQGIIPKAL